jgi:SpoVK/Ycf46/Vps4 family AAA+-type ATPase
MVTLDEFERNFTSAYKSSHPIICIETYEEEWALQFFDEYIAKNKIHDENVTRVLANRYIWSRAKGFNKTIKIESSREGEEDVTFAPEQTKSPVAALMLIYRYIRSKNTPATMFIMRDLNEDLERNADVQRLLREIFFYGESTKHVLVLMQPDFNIVGALEKEITLLDFAVPSVEEHKEFYKEYVEAQKIEDKLTDEEREQYFAGLAGLTRFEANHLIMEMAYEKQGVIDSSLLEYAKNKKKENIRKGKLLEYVDTNITINDIGGADLLKQFLEKEADATTPAARAFGINPPKGIILFGPPGTGKTQFAKATANALNMPLIAWNIGKMFGGLVGQSESTTRQTIKQLENYAPAVVLLDEIDKYLGGLKGSSGDSGVGSRVLGTILSFMSDTTAPLFFVATSNSINLPPEILRKGRWDEMFYVPLPSIKARRQIFRIHLRKVGRDPKQFNVKELALNSKLFSGAEIEQAIQEALKHAYHEGDEDITDVHILKALEETRPIAETMREEMSALQKFANERARSASSSKDFEYKTEENSEDDTDSPFVPKAKQKQLRSYDEDEE